MNTIYVKLLDEGVDVWRPVSVKRVNENIYKIIAKNDSDDEKWQFNYDDNVLVKKHRFDDGTEGFIALEKI